MISHGPYRSARPTLHGAYLSDIVSHSPSCFARRPAFSILLIDFVPWVGMWACSGEAMVAK
ncbi:hypothetical protein KSS87_017353 [Heliosperma pusillum]|nr:hypothetical protein KSS87_021216 [Heliosperma pusillum]KAH9615088.1 hypothetical protein KSS87_017353 [Heliosperma pusillum]